MLSDFMLTRFFAPAAALVYLALSILTAGCEKVPLLAPTGSTITLSSSVTVLPSNGSISIVALVLEAPGTPPHSGTQITFTTTLGTIEPAQANTDNGGRVTVTFNAGNNNGVATISATSGGATTGTTGALKISVGTAAVGKVTLSANPAAVPNVGGSTTIAALVLDINGNPLPGAAVAFTTTFGTLSSALVLTSAGGIAATTLTTSQAATVTASVGAQAPSTGTGTGTGAGGGTGSGSGTSTSSGQASAQITVSASTGPVVVIKQPTNPPSAGLPATYTFTVTAGSSSGGTGGGSSGGSAIRDVTVDWGDGKGQDLGAVTGDAAVAHVYVSPGTYTIAATATDAAGNVTRVTSAVVVIPVPKPGIQVTQSPTPGKVGAQTTLTILVTVPTGLSVQDLAIDFGDGTRADLGGATSAAVPHVYTAIGTYTVTVTVVDTSGQTTVGTAVVSIST